MRLMRRLGIPTRSYRDALKLVTKTEWMTPEILRELYWDKKLSTKAIGDRVGVDGSWICSLMEKYDIPRRTISEACMKYPKSAFSGDILEASYLLGLRTGDLNVGSYGLQIRVATTTSHPAMWRLLSNTFGKYGHVGKSASFSRQTFQWCVYCYLDRSFDFLFEKPRRIPETILDDDARFMAFLAGYIDAEGSFRIYPDGKSTGFSLRINSEDETILRQISSRLKSGGFHTYFALAAEGGRKPKRYRENLWTFGMFRKREILALVPRLPIQHDEKTRITYLMLRASASDWAETRPEWDMLKQSIKSEVTSFAAEAKPRYFTQRFAR